MPEVVISLLSVIAVPVIDNAPEIIVETLTVPVDAFTVNAYVLELIMPEAIKLPVSVYVSAPVVITSAFKVMLLPLTPKVPEVIAARLTAPVVVIVKLLLPVLSSSLAVIVPLELLIVSESAKV